MSEPLILYHAGCYDGFTAAWVAHRARGGGELVPVNYGQPAPDVTGREVYVLDFSYPREVLLELYEQASLLIILDHHKTAAEDLEGLDFCVFDQNESGASLAHQWFHPGEELPALVRYVRDRDLWRFEMPDSKAVHAWLRSHEFDLDFWDEAEAVLGTETLRRGAVEAGRAILRVQAKQVAAHVQRGQLVRLGGVDFLACNCSLSTLHSEVAGALAKTTEAGAIWMEMEEYALWSLRGRGDVDVSAIAKKFGGGGHHNAAGFRLPLWRHCRLLATAAETWVSPPRGG